MKPFIYERKFVGKRGTEEYALSWLEHSCLPDPEYPFGVISNIYYDTPRLSSYNEKLNGELIKTKMRLRWYEGEEDVNQEQVNAFLEVKFRVGGGRRKVRKRFTLDRKWLRQTPLEDDALRELAYRQVQAVDFPEAIPADLFPVITLTYDRFRFVCPFSGARVCLDANIRTGRINSTLLPTIGALPLNAVVVELKDAEIAEVPWLDNLYRAGFRNRGFSKYAICMSKIIQGAAL